MAAVLNHEITINKGATYRQKFIWSAGSPAIPVDNTNYTARMQIREDIDDAGTILSITDTVTINVDGILLGGINGEVDVVLTATTTEAIAEDGGVYDLELVAPSSGDVTRLLEGSVTFSPEVTR